MYIKSTTIMQKSNQGGPECVNTTDNITALPGEEDIATPGSAA